MFRHILKAVEGELSGRIAHRHVAEIIRYHRIQASPGYRQAANYAATALKESGLSPSVLSYKSDPGTRYWANPMFDEWDCQDAVLKLVTPAGEARFLANYQETKISIIQRSAPTPLEGVECDLVVLDRADEPGSYEGVDVKGKIVMFTGDITRVERLAVEERGAVGLLTDHLNEFPPIRARMDIPDAIQYTSFWWSGEKDEKRCFGFVLSPKAGERLRKLDARLKKEAAAKGKAAEAIRLYARVDSHLYPGAIEDVTATIKGETDEEVLAVAHLCHPQWSANDNASGSGVVLEVARTLQRLISSGALPRPKRTIRFLLVPEMSGTYAYLASNENDIPKMVSAVNLDMVGENQDLCKSIFQVERPPHAMPDFTGDLFEKILLDVAQDAKNLAGTSAMALFRWAVTNFSGGSDHYIFSDPTVGVPCPMLIQWPDKFYHTSEDTLDKVDPEMLRKVGLLTATYLYFVATAGYPAAVWLAGEMAASFAAEAHSIARENYLAAVAASGASPVARGGQSATPTSPAQTMNEALAKTGRVLKYRLERKLLDLNSLTRLLAPAEKAAFSQYAKELEAEMLATVSDEECRARASARAYLAACRDCGSPEAKPSVPATAADKEAATVVPRRLYPGPISLRGYMHFLSEGRRDEWRRVQEERKAGGRTATQAMYWTDGKRTVAEIADLVELETGLRDTGYLMEFYKLLSELKLVELSSK